MDYRQFFEELKSCYESNGLPFEYDFKRSVAKVQANNLNLLNMPPYCYSKQTIKSSNKSAKSKFRFNLYDDFIKAMKPESLNAREYFFVPRLFYGVEDMVYSLAWELSCKIGRLPDALHARMVFSLDGHRAIRRYIKEHGV